MKSVRFDRSVESLTRRLQERFTSRSGSSKTHEVRKPMKSLKDVEAILHAALKEFRRDSVRSMLSEFGINDWEVYSENHWSIPPKISLGGPDTD